MVYGITTGFRTALTDPASPMPPHCPGYSLLQAIGLTAMAAIPLLNMAMLYGFAKGAKAWNETSPNDSHADVFHKESGKINAMSAVATFMVAVGAALLLVGLYYHTIPDYEMLFMIGEIVAGIGGLLFFTAACWHARSEQEYRSYYEPCPGEPE